MFGTHIHTRNFQMSQYEESLGLVKSLLEHGFLNTIVRRRKKARFGERM